MRVRSFGQEENELALDVSWDCPPTLFVATDRFQRDPKKTGEFFLGFFHLFPDVDEFFAVHIVVEEVKD